MKSNQHIIRYEEFTSSDKLITEDKALLEKAREATADAYAPYSHFKVGAAAKLDNGEIVTGTNQENASYPVGICAERTLLAAVSTQFKGRQIVAMAVSYDNEGGDSDQPVAPCGMCRQSLVEFETRMQHPIKIIMGGLTGGIITVENATSLLPFAFHKTAMTKKKKS
ncbi:MAG: cytidine deaminase [Chitinophagaceae bacterium]|nr:MAG: cytidine deaminase [Chitinophagaceae bacterium]